MITVVRIKRPEWVSDYAADSLTHLAFCTLHILPQLNLANFLQQQTQNSTTTTLSRQGKPVYTSTWIFYHCKLSRRACQSVTTVSGMTTSPAIDYYYMNSSQQLLTVCTRQPLPFPQNNDNSTITNNSSVVRTEAGPAFIHIHFALLLIAIYGTSSR